MATHNAAVAMATALTIALALRRRRQNHLPLELVGSPIPHFHCRCQLQIVRHDLHCRVDSDMGVGQYCWPHTIGRYHSLCGSDVQAPFNRSVSICYSTYSMLFYLVPSHRHGTNHCRSLHRHPRRSFQPAIFGPIRRAPQEAYNYQFPTGSVREDNSDTSSTSTDRSSRTAGE